MNILICVSFFAILPSIDGLLCNSYDNQPYVAFTIDEVNNWAKQYRQEKTQDMCNILIQYSNPIIILDLKEEEKDSELIDGDIQWVTSIQSANDTIIEMNILHYSCSNYDFCEMDFLIEHISWFINQANQQKFINQILPLLNIENDIVDNCYSWDEQIKACPQNTLCAFIFSSEENILLKTCSENIPHGIAIGTRINRKTLQEEQIVTFGCLYDRCNSNETFLQLKFFIDQYHDLTLIRNALVNNQSIKIDQNITTQTDFQQTEFTTASTSTSQATQTTNSYSIYRLYLAGVLLYFFN